MNELIVGKEYDIFQVYGGRFRGSYEKKIKTEYGSTVIFNVNGKRTLFEKHLIHWKLVK